jgi:serine/threonine protein kinase
MTFIVPMADAQADHPDYTFISPLTPSEQKAAFHVKDADGEDLCLKIIAPNYSIDRLQREILALQSISHPNVVRLREYTYSSTPTSLRHFMIEDFVEGTDLADRLVNSARLARPETSTLFSEVCDGLGALREANIVHRDMKPTNIRVRPGGSPVIIDFGLARHLDRVALTNTSEGAAIGTPMYFAPEQFTGTKHDIDHRTDLFAVGVLIYQALVGKHPFWASGMSRQQLCDAVCSSTTHLSDVQFVAIPHEWKLLIGRLLEKERARRPQSANQVATILRKIGNV